MKELLGGSGKKHVKEFEFDLAARRYGLGRQHSSNALAGLRGDGQRQRKISMDDLFVGKPENLRSPHAEIKNVLAIGNPGTGKTSMCKRLAHDWACGQWGAEFKAVYVVSLRAVVKSEFGGSTKRTFLEDVVESVSFSRVKDVSDRALATQIRDDLEEETTLLLVDGLDEAHGLGIEVAKAALACNAKSVFFSRPIDADVVYDREVEVLGLSDEQLARFVSSELGVEDGRGFVDELKENDAVWEISHVPVTAKLLCILRRERGASSVTLSSFSLYDLYSDVAAFVWNRYIQKTDSLGVIRTDVFDVLGRIAMDTLDRDEILISEYTVLEYLSSEGVKKFLLHGGFLLFSREGKKYQVPHLTFHEYFAGTYAVTKLCGPESTERYSVERFISEHKYHSAFRVVFMFMMEGACKTHGMRAMKSLFDLFEKPPLSVVGPHQMLLQLRLVEAFLCCSPEASRSEIDDDPTIQILIVQASGYIEGLKKGYDGFADEFAFKLVENFLSGFEFVPRTVEYFEAVSNSLSSTGNCSKPAGLTALAVYAGRMAKKTKTLSDKFLQAIRCMCVDENPEARKRGFAFLRGFATYHPDLSDELAELALRGCCDNVVDVRVAALFSSGTIVAPSSELHESIMNLLRTGRRDEDEAVRAGAIGGMISFAANHKDLDGDIAGGLDRAYEDEGSRRMIVNALGDLIEHRPEMLEIGMKYIEAGMENDDDDVSRAAFVHCINIASEHPKVLERAVEFWRRRWDSEDDKEIAHLLVTVIEALLSPSDRRDHIVDCIQQMLLPADDQVRTVCQEMSLCMRVKKMIDDIEGSMNVSLFYGVFFRSP